MSRQLLVDVRPFDISREKINESIKDNDGKLMTNIFPLGGVKDERNFT